MTEFQTLLFALAVIVLSIIADVLRGILRWLNNLQFTFEKVHKP